MAVEIECVMVQKAKTIPTKEFFLDLHGAKSLINIHSISFGKVGFEKKRFQDFLMLAYRLHVCWHSFHNLIVLGEISKVWLD